MALRTGAAQPVRGGVRVLERVYVDAAGDRVPAGSPRVARLFAAAGAVISTADARQLGLIVEDTGEVNDASGDDGDARLDSVGGGWYVLPNGERVRGRDGALARLAELDASEDAS